MSKDWPPQGGGAESGAMALKKKLSPAQRKLVGLLRDGHRLWWFGDNGPEIDGRPFWPQKRMVRTLLGQGVLRWKPYLNETQRQCGFRELELAPHDQTTR